MIYYKFLRLESIYYFCEIDYIFKTEQWKPIIGYVGIYEVSDLGRVKSLSRPRKTGVGFFITKEFIKKQNANIHGYLSVSLCKNSINIFRKVHILISMCFLGHEGNGNRRLVINHKDFIRTNNKLVNLEIVTFRENANQKHRKSSSKYTGVIWDKSRSKWQAKIYINGKTVHLGRYVKEIDAHHAYENKLKQISQ